ncbi:MAG: phycobiliprotein lyase [Chamaesiphon sp.]|nr:phycobiliprotein lyase [Chamaesiphon sp.]
MDITQFVAGSIGQWKSQRSAHHMIFGHFEAVRSEIDIAALTPDNLAVIELCQSYDIDPSQAVDPFHMSWEGESDWVEKEVLKGSTVLVPIPDLNLPNQGLLLRDRGYAETMAAAARYHITEDGVFVLITEYDRAAAEERIWFVNPNLRFRVSTIKTSDGTGVVTASFSSELRTMPKA